MRIDFEGWNPPHVSHSTVTGWGDCGMRTKLGKVLKIEQRPGLAATGGNAVHTGTEMFDKGEGPDATELFMAGWAAALEKNKGYSPNYEVDQYIVTGRAAAAYGGRRNLQWWMDNGPVMVQAWIDWRANHPDWHIWETPDNVPAIEWEFRIELPGSIVVLGFVDRVMVTPAGQLTPVDIKSGRTPETAEQLGLYATALELKYGEMFRPSWGYWWDAQKGSHSNPLMLDMYTADYLGARYAEAINGMNAGVYLAKPNNNCFAWCGLSHACPANPNSQVQS